jgi:hypothetical protein
MDAPRQSRLEPGFALVAAALLAVTGCTSVTPRESAPAPAPDLQLLSAGALALPQDCEPRRGTMYRTSFVVEPGGGVSTVTSDSGDGCVERALRAWVASFRYAAPERTVPTVIDWMYVTASRGT